MTGIRSLQAVLLCVIIVACDDTLGPDVTNAFSCSQTGTQHRDAMASGTWRAQGGPHWLMNMVSVDSLEIEPGTLVCAMPNTALAVRVLIARGTEAQPIRFLAGDSTSAWHGITINAELSGASIRGGKGEISHALVERGSVTAGTYSVLWVSDSHFRHANVGNGSSFSALDIQRTVVDTGSVFITGSGTFEETTIRAGGLVLNASGHGGPASITINGGRIEDSPGVAVKAGWRNGPEWPTLSVLNTLRVVGSRGGVGDMHVTSFVSLWPTREAQDSLLGNPDATLNLWGTSLFDGSGMDAGHVYIRRELPWIVSGYLGAVTVASATVEAGASISLDATNFIVKGNVTAVGSESMPIQIAMTTEGCYASYTYPCRMWLTGSASSQLSHVTISGAYLQASEQHRVQIDHLQTDRLIDLRSPGSSIVDSEIHDVTSHGWAAALWLGADSIRAERVIVRRSRGTTSDAADAKAIAGIAINGSGVQVLNCDVSDNDGNGIQVVSGSNVEIHDCNIELNGGLGVENGATSLVAAQRNWWGDPAGPLGPAGDGVSNNVDYSSFLTSPQAR